MSNHRFKLFEASLGFDKNPGTFHASASLTASQDQIDTICVFFSDPSHFNGKKLSLGGPEEVTQENINKLPAALKNNQMQSLKIEGDKEKKDKKSSFHDTSEGTNPIDSPTAAPKQTPPLLDLSSLFRALQNHQTLTSLVIQNIDLSHENSMSLLNRLIRDNKHITELKLINCHLANHRESLVFLGDNTAIEHLDISNNHLTDKYADLLILRLKEAEESHIETMVLTDNAISTAKLNEIQACLDSNASLNAIRINTDELNMPLLQSNAGQAEPAKENASSPYLKARLIGGAAGFILASIAVSVAAIFMTTALIASGPIGWASLAGIMIAITACGALFGDVVAEHQAEAAMLSPQNNDEVAPMQSSDQLLKTRFPRPEAAQHKAEVRESKQERRTLKAPALFNPRAFEDSEEIEGAGVFESEEERLEFSNSKYF